MKFDFQTYTIKADLQRPQMIVSPHTGRELRRGEIRFRTDAPELVEALQRDAVLTESGTEREWRVARQTFTSTSDQSDVTAVGLEIEEMENRKATALEFGGLTVTPERYEERADGDELLVKARAAFRGDDLTALRQMLSKDDETVDLVRRGVSDRPRGMHIEALIWSQPSENDDAVFDLEFTEPRKPNSRVPVGGMFADWSSVRVAALFGLAGVLEIVETLAAKNLLTKDEASDLKKRYAERAEDLLLACRKCSDVRAVPFSRSDEPSTARKVTTVERTQ